MKKYIIPVTALLVAIFVFVDIKQKQNKKPEEKEEIVKRGDSLTQRELSPKEKFLYSLDSLNRGHVNIIDSLNPLNPWLNLSGIEIALLKEKKWREIKNESTVWYEYGVKFSRHIGHAYVVTIEKIEGWKESVSKDYKNIEYVLQYGVLLDSDTIDGRIINKGTYIISPFTRKNKVDKGEYEIAYISNYQELLMSIREETGIVTRTFDWIYGANPTGKILLRL
ncbi:MAG: hypothetical protein WDK96_02245 [Candidatus Paceibacterota bacterium]|jgi:hypothetical protein